ncbi:dehydrogenase/reductase SDR family member 12 [Rana temporaria]|uniref:dehydrogenase/reductase SDR family member 12 n=1 Tax=Rana temporaria TaxID=8407 RepID=UPI001AAC693B|nr:dehydrogenase/reductase SDR family member 12 [Rana temporaria]
MSLYRNTVWFLKGLREYTKGGYESAAKYFVAEDLQVDVKEKSYMITGANSGIGKAAALAIAKRGGTVHLVCRNKDRAEEAQTEIITNSGNERVFVHLLDMSDPKEIWAFAEKFKTQNRLNVLINNAGCMVNKRELTEDGIEKNFATNVLGTYILTRALLPVLENEEGARVVSIEAIYLSCVCVCFCFFKEDLLDFILVILRSHFMLGRASSICFQLQIFNSIPLVYITPTISITNTATVGHCSCTCTFFNFIQGVPDWNFFYLAVRLSMPDFYEKMKTRLRTEEQGADTVVWLTISPAAVKHPSGLFFQDRKPVATHLPLAFTHSSTDDEEKFLQILQDMALKFAPSSKL